MFDGAPRCAMTSTRETLDPGADRRLGSAARAPARLSAHSRYVATKQYAGPRPSATPGVRRPAGPRWRQWPASTQSTRSTSALRERSMVEGPGCARPARCFTLLDTLCGWVGYRLALINTSRARSASMADIVSTRTTSAPPTRRSRPMSITGSSRSVLGGDPPERLIGAGFHCSTPGLMLHGEWVRVHGLRGARIPSAVADPAR